jgi:hypothetical protein
MDKRTEAQKSANPASFWNLSLSNNACTNQLQPARQTLFAQYLFESDIPALKQDSGSLQTISCIRSTNILASSGFRSSRSKKERGCNCLALWLQLVLLRLPGTSSALVAGTAGVPPETAKTPGSQSGFEKFSPPTKKINRRSRRSDSQHSCSYQVLPLRTGDVVAGTAGVPSRVMQLITDIRHGRSVNNLTVRGRLWIDVDGRQVVRLLDVGAWKARKARDMNRGFEVAQLLCQETLMGGNGGLRTLNMGFKKPRYGRMWAALEHQHADYAGRLHNIRMLEVVSQPSNRHVRSPVCNI